jgi:hypothetical protein
VKYLQAVRTPVKTSPPHRHSTIHQWEAAQCVQCSACKVPYLYTCLTLFHRYPLAYPRPPTTGAPHTTPYPMARTGGSRRTQRPWTRRGHQASAGAQLSQLQHSHSQTQSLHKPTKHSKHYHTTQPAHKTRLHLPTTERSNRHQTIVHISDRIRVLTMSVQTAIHSVPFRRDDAITDNGRVNSNCWTEAQTASTTRLQPVVHTKLAVLHVGEVLLQG